MHVIYLIAHANYFLLAGILVNQGLGVLHEYTVLKQRGLKQLYTF